MESSVTVNFKYNKAAQYILKIKCFAKFLLSFYFSLWKLQLDHILQKGTNPQNLNKM